MPAPGPRPELVVFDLGGVLVRIARSWAQACASAGIDLRGDADAASTWAAREPYIVAHETGRIGREAFCAGLAGATGSLYTPEEVGRVHDAVLLGEYAGIAAVFDAAERAGVPTAVLSNTNASHWDVQFPTSGRSLRFPTLARVRHPHASHVLGARKPDREAFLALEAATGRPRHVLFFDDLERNVAGARAAGWDAVLIDPLADPPAQMLAALQARLASRTAR